MDELIFNNALSDVYIPDPNISMLEALRRTTHLCIGAHQDDVEIMAYNGISKCYHNPEKWFTGVVVTDGGGSPRTGKYSDTSYLEMTNIRKEEQKEAASIGAYNMQIQLGYSSSHVKRSLSDNTDSLLKDLIEIFRHCTPEVVYLHQPTDRHDTHVAVFILSINAMRELHHRPEKVIGCEVWGSLDWIDCNNRCELDTGKYPILAEQLLKVYDSQISGGKRYDLATLGRRKANATYSKSHSTDEYESITIGINLMPLINNKQLSIKTFTSDLLDKFKLDTENRLSQLMPQI